MTARVPRYLRPLWRTLKPAGWPWRYTHGQHVALVGPHGERVIASLTPRSGETAKRVAAECRRAERRV